MCKQTFHLCYVYVMTGCCNVHGIHCVSDCKYYQDPVQWHDASRSGHIRGLPLDGCSTAISARLADAFDIRSCIILAGKRLVHPFVLINQACFAYAYALHGMRE